jgi:hypothetical protein
VAYRGKTANPFEGIPVLGQIEANTPGGFDAYGFVRTDGSWAAGVHIGLGSVRGMPSAYVDVSGSSVLGGFLFSGRVTLFDVPEVGQADVGISGFVDTQGHYSFTGYADVTEHVLIRLSVSGGGGQHVSESGYVHIDGLGTFDLF